MKPAARISDMHLCPLVTSTVPHVGGPILGPGVPSVLIGNLPAAVLGDNCYCNAPPTPPNKCAIGSATVLIGGKPAVRVGDSTLHGGVITTGFPSVLIGG